MASAVRRLSPVSMTVRMPSSFSAARPAAASGRGSSRMAISPATAPPASSTETVLPSPLKAVDREALRLGQRSALGRRLAASRGTAPRRRRCPRRPCRRSPSPPNAGGTGTLSALALSRIATASGWLEPCSSAAASDSTSRSSRPIRDDVGDHGLAFGQRAGLVEGDGGDPAQALEHRAALHQQAAPRAGREAGGDRRRRRDDQRAGTADQQDGEALVDPFVPVAAERAAAAATATSAPTTSTAGV